MRPSARAQRCARSTSAALVPSRRLFARGGLTQPWVLRVLTHAGVPTLIAVHPDNDPNKDGLEIAKAYAAATGEYSRRVQPQQPVRRAAVVRR